MLLRAAGLRHYRVEGLNADRRCPWMDLNELQKNWHELGKIAVWFKDKSSLPASVQFEVAVPTWIGYPYFATKS